MSSPSFIEFGQPPFPRSDTLSQSGPLKRAFNRNIRIDAPYGCISLFIKGRTTKKVMGRVEKKTKKNSCKGKCQEKKIRAKKEGKEKKFMQRESPIVTFIQDIKSASVYKNTKYRRHTDPNGGNDQNEMKRYKGLNYFCLK